MSFNNKNTERDSFWKSPMLKQGEYDVWASEMEAHVMSVDAQCWKLIKGGDEKIVIIMGDKEIAKPLVDYKEPDFKFVEFSKP